MSAAHFLCEDLSGDRIVLEGDEAFHAARALRVRAGERVTLADGRGGAAAGVVQGPPRPDRVVITVAERWSVPRSRPSVRLLPAVPKRGKLDLIVQKVTELGTDRITPWFAERSIASWEQAKRRAQGERLRAIARAASKQSGRAWLPMVDDPDVLPPLPPGAVVLHEGASQRLLAALPAEPPDQVAIVVGPEGGLSDAELSRFEGEGAQIATLGEAILRADTAAIITSALVLSHFHLLG